MVKSNTIITDNITLNEFYNKCIKEKVLAVDTEFIRDNTYYPSLCLIQIAGENFAAAIDPLSGLEMQPVWDLLANEKILKVFHAARQDIEIFLHLTEEIPKPIFDTQIAAMFCGLGEQVGYEKLVNNFLDLSINKENQFTNWLQRPLTKNQIEYAISDVTHLIKIYPLILKSIKDLNREDWVQKETEYLTNKNLYITDPMTAWERIKIKQLNRETLNYLKYLASWREIECKKRNVPRNRLIRDEVLVNIAVLKPREIDKLKKIRGISKNLSIEDFYQILETLKQSTKYNSDQWPQINNTYKKKNVDKCSLELLKLLLLYCSEKSGLAQKLIADTEDLRNVLLNPNRNHRMFIGWRNKIFGYYVNLLLDGKLAFTIENNKIKQIKF
mgnify:FL=1